MTAVQPPDHKTNTPTSLPDDVLDLKILLPVALGDDSVLPEGFDRERYIAALDSLGISEKEKSQYINICYQICETVIAMCFGVDPEKIARDCKAESLQKPSASMVSLKPPARDAFKIAGRLPQHDNRVEGE